MKERVSKIKAFATSLLSQQGRGSCTRSLLCNAPLAPVFEVIYDKDFQPKDSK